VPIATSIRVGGRLCRPRSATTIVPVVELVVLIGLPGAGKSTFHRERFAASHVHASLDLLRNARRRVAREHELVRESLCEGRSVVVDDTNVRRSVRAALVAIGREHGARVVAYYFDESARDCLARNRAREGRARVPDVAVFAKAKRLERPTLDEGFDAIFRVRVQDGAFVVEPFEAEPATSA
jgi:predicted kinase